MRKILSIALFTAIVAIGVSSCKSKQTCPAYGKVNTSNHTVKSI